MSSSGWLPDPFGRHQYRWWDGARWTDQVADDGVAGLDPADGPVVPPPPPAVGLRDVPRTDLGRRFEESRWQGEAPLVASRWQRVGGYFLEALLSVVTLGIGWLVWSLIIYGRGQTPAKQVLNLRLVSVQERRCLGWGQTAAREWIFKGPLVYLIIVIGLGGAGVHVAWVLALHFVLAAWWLINLGLLLAEGWRQTAWDKALNAVVINDHDRRFDPRSTPHHPQPDPSHTAIKAG